MASIPTKPLRRCASLLTVLYGARLTAADVSTNALPPAATNRVDFVRDIKPIFDRSCIRCHGPEKPKSNFRLTSRDAAIKGGENGVAIISGDNAKSPLIHYVARLPEVEDMWMPPPGKGEPLTEAEVAMLRAWVDQGVAWEEAAPPPKVEISLSPMFGWSTVDGNERVFREHQWLREGWSGGVSQFRLRERLTDNTFLTAEGHALEDDYNVGLTLERPELGFLRAGVERYRKFSSDSGGRYEPFEPDIFRLDKDLHLNIGRAWADLGFTVPDLPRIVIGYEYQYREGTKSTLQWGPVTQGTEAGGVPRMRNIYPAYKWVDEQVHIVKMDASYSIAGFEFDNRFRGEFYDLDTERVNARGLDRDAGQLRPGVFEEIQEGQTHFEGANTFRVEKQFRDWLFGSAGYHFARLDADAFFDLNWNTVSGPPGFRQDWRTPEIVLDREIHAGSVSTLLGPWAGLTASAGVQTEFSEQHGMGGAVVETGFGPFPPIIATNSMASDIDRKALQETLALRYTTIPFTVLFAEARLQQESIDHFEEQESSGPSPQPLLLRDTEASSDLKDFRGGFTTSPWRRLSLTAHYRRYEKDSYYDHLRDVLLGGEGFGYSAFIRRRKVVSDEIEPKLVWHTASWLKTTLSYKLVASDFHTATEGISVLGTDYAGDERIYAANYDAHVYSVNFSLSPWRRFYLSTTFSFQDTRTAASVPDDMDSVVPYKGNVYSVLTSGTVPLSEKNDLQVSYSFSHADYEQDNEEAGLPVGIVYDLHGAQIGLTRRVAKNIATNLRYGFFQYDEPTSGGVNDYTAHLIFGTVVVRFP